MIKVKGDLNSKFNTDFGLIWWSIIRFKSLTGWLTSFLVDFFVKFITRFRDPWTRTKPTVHYGQKSSWIPDMRVNLRSCKVTKGRFCSFSWRTKRLLWARAYINPRLACLSIWFFIDWVLLLPKMLKFTIERNWKIFFETFGYLFIYWRVNIQGKVVREPFLSDPLRSGPIIPCFSSLL